MTLKGYFAERSLSSIPEKFVPRKCVSIQYVVFFPSLYLVCTVRSVLPKLTWSVIILPCDLKDYRLALIGAGVLWV